LLTEKKEKEKEGVPPYFDCLEEKTEKSLYSTGMSGNKLTLEGGEGGRRISLLVVQGERKRSLTPVVKKVAGGASRKGRKEKRGDIRFPGEREKRWGGKEGHGISISSVQTGEKVRVQGRTAGGKGGSLAVLWEGRGGKGVKKTFFVRSARRIREEEFGGKGEGKERREVILFERCWEGKKKKRKGDVLVLIGKGGELGGGGGGGKEGKKSFFQSLRKKKKGGVMRVVFFEPVWEDERTAGERGVRVGEKGGRGMGFFLSGLGRGGVRSL